MGGIGSGKSFKNNYNSLSKIELNMRTFHDVNKVDTSITLFGEDLLSSHVCCYGRYDIQYGVEGQDDRCRVYRWAVGRMQTCSSSDTIDCACTQNEECITRVAHLATNGKASFSIYVVSLLNGVVCHPNYPL